MQPNYYMGTSTPESNFYTTDVKPYVQGWWFSRTNNKLRYGDNRVAAIGRKHKIKGYPILCERGFHASTNILDAIQYAPGPILWKVKISGEIISSTDKMVGTQREYTHRIDITDILNNYINEKTGRTINIKNDMHSAYSILCCDIVIWQNINVNSELTQLIEGHLE